MKDLRKLLNAVKPICSAFRQGKPTLNKDLKRLSRVQQEIESKEGFFTDDYCDCIHPRVKKYIDSTWICTECERKIK